MNYSIIIAEFNPLSNGHKYIIEKTMEMFPLDPIIVIMSGNFVQRGEPAIINKFERANVATMLGASAVIELPTIFSISSAEDFAFGAVKIANSISGAKRIVFGSECGDISILEKTAELLNSTSIQNEIKKHLSAGNSYATSLRLALNNNTILNSPNNLLGIEYIKAIKSTNSNLQAVTIKRDYGYNDKSLSPFASSSALREQVFAGNLDCINNCLPDLMLDKLKTAQTPVLDKLHSMLLYKLATMPLKDLQKIDGINEGLEFRILDKAKLSTNFGDLVAQISTKRYPESKVKRVLLNVLFDITKKTKQTAKKAKPILTVLSIAKDKSILSALSNSNGTLVSMVRDCNKLDTSQQQINHVTTLADKIYANLTNIPTSSIYNHKL